MPTTIVVGGQYGSEGKGKTVALLAAKELEPWVVRCGGPNSGHTTCLNGEEVVLRQLPAAAGHPSAILLLSAACAIDEDLLLREVQLCRIDRERLIVDPRAVLVNEADRRAEEGLRTQVGSTASGTGSALSRRMLRECDTKLAGTSERIRSIARVDLVAPFLHRQAERRAAIIVEGTQGFGLSLFHGPNYPFVTARDTTASAFASEAGIPPACVDNVVLVIRTFPIRVGGNSGPLHNEITWDELRDTSGAPRTFPEYASVTKSLRRVARFDPDLVKSACLYNRPTSISLMGLDRVDYSDSGSCDLADISPLSRDFVLAVRHLTDTPIGILGTGFKTADAIVSPNGDLAAVFRASGERARSSMALGL